jgi:flagellar biosynthesis protein FliP
MKYVIIGLALAASLYIMTGYAFTKGYEQGYVDGRQRALMTEPELYKQCTAWWFDGNEPRAMKEINKYCDRRNK